MKILFRQIVFLIMCFISLNASAFIPPNLNDEKQVIVFDNRPWQAVSEEIAEMGTTLEYIVQGDNIDHWHELITSQYYPGLQNIFPNITDFVMAMYGVLQEQVPVGATLQVRGITQSADKILWEFRIESPDKSQQQDELQLVTKTADGYYLLHYVINQSDMGQEKRDEWIDHLSMSKLKP